MLSSLVEIDFKPQTISHQNVHAVLNKQSDESDSCFSFSSQGDRFGLETR